jgi:hypothetical protein
MRSVLPLWRVRDDMLQTLQPVRADVIGCSTMMGLVCNYYHLSPHIRAHVLCTLPHAHALCLSQYRARGGCRAHCSDGTSFE